MSKPSKNAYRDFFEGLIGESIRLSFYGKEWYNVIVKEVNDVGFWSANQFYFYDHISWVRIEQEDEDDE